MVTSSICKGFITSRLASSTTASADLSRAIRGLLGGGQVGAKIHIILTDSSSLRKSLTRGPNLPPRSLLPLVEIGHNVAHHALKVKGALFHFGMQLAIDKDSSVQVLLGLGAKLLVLGHDALEHLVHQLELFVAGAVLAENFIAHQGAGRGDGDEALHEEEVGTISMISKEVDLYWGKKYSRYSHGSIGEVVGAADGHALGNLLRCSTGVMDDAPILGINVVS